MTTQLKKASTLKEVHSLFNPKHYLETPAELQDFYVDRKSFVCDGMIIELEESLETQKAKHLFFTGHRGSGKSTEINKLRLDLKDSFFVVPVSFKDRPDVDYIDLILKAANSLFKAATEEEIIKKAPKQIGSDFWQMLTHFFEKKIYGEFLPDFSEIDSQTKIKLESVTGKINLLAIEFESRFEIDPESRKKFKENSSLLIPEVIDKINMLAERVFKNYGQPVLFIFEDADKFDLKNSEEIFYKHCNTLVSIRASSIYVIDIALRYNVEFTNARACFDEFFCLPNIKLLSKDNQATDNFKLLEAIIDNRAENHLFGTGAKNLLIACSGGLVRSLIDLVKTAARRAIIESAERIEQRHVEHAISRMRGDFIAVLNDDYYALLKTKHKTKKLDNEATTQYLLQSLALLEYENGEIWCDVHPIIRPEVESRTQEETA
jgi:energy-coupling factor transporter ATP-binding protein EcfA2